MSRECKTQFNGILPRCIATLKLSLSSCKILWGYRLEP